MNEEDYVQLHTLLAKFRVVAMKEYGDEDTPYIAKAYNISLSHVTNEVKK